MGKTFALIISVGKYDNPEKDSLRFYKEDLFEMQKILSEGLKLDKENIRSLGETGRVTVRSFARALSEFSNVLTEKDCFLLYFSGHGINGNLCFTDGDMKLSGIISYLNEWNIQSKLMILDCCNAGAFSLGKPNRMMLEQTIHDFAGHGIAVLAASAEDKESWSGPKENTASVFTTLIRDAVFYYCSRIRGKISFAQISDTVFFLAEQWNKKQEKLPVYPIYRSRLGGAVYFETEKELPYISEKKQQEILQKEEQYIICTEQDLSTRKEKRKAVFVQIYEKYTPEQLAFLTRKIIRQVERADAVWCYFGCDESDMITHRFYAHSIYAKGALQKEKYYKKGKNIVQSNDVCVQLNSSYEMLRRLQAPACGKEEFQQMVMELLREVISKAEIFVVDLEAVFNREKMLDKIQKEYTPWIKGIYRLYDRLADLPMAPDELYVWYGKVMDLAGYILDLAIYLKRKDLLAMKNYLNYIVRSYQDTLMELKQFS